MKIKLLFVAILCVVTNYVSAQAYSTAIGVRGGFPGAAGINLKHDFGGIYGDFTLGGNKNWFSLTALAEKQQTLSGNFDWYVGLGPYVYSWRNSYYYDDKIYNSGLAFGAYGCAGIEYTFDEIPFNIGLDVGPAVNIVPYFSIGFGGNFSFRYVLK